MAQPFPYQTWFSNDTTKYIIHCGKTGSGKTYNAIKRLKEVGSGVYLAPLRLLALEIYEKFNSEGIRCNLLTGEEQDISERAKITSSTIEMLDYSKRHEVVVIDEAFMLSDRDRGKAWLRAIIKAKATEVHIITSEDALELITNILSMTGRAFELKNYKMLQQFKFTNTVFSFNSNMPPRGVFVTFSRIDVLINKMKLQKLGKGVSVLYGNLPPEVKKRQIEEFVNGNNELMVCTDVIGMGVNLPCDYIVFLKHEKFDGKQQRTLLPTEVRQISGRTGRYGVSAENCFVSATNNGTLNYIKSNYGKPVDIKQTFLGLDFEIYSFLPEGATIMDRLNHFKFADLIPPKLQKIVRKEWIGRYVEVMPYISKMDFDLKEQWVFLTAPVKDNNREYFMSCIQSYYKDKTIHIPKDTTPSADAKWMEDKISEIELYLNLSRMLGFVEYEKEQIHKDKQALITALDAFLLDRKLAHKKKCKLCPTMLDITYPYPYCNTCYEEKVANNYSYY